MKRKTGFSLLELIVVIGVLAVLGTIMMGQFGKSMASARNVKCLSNLRTLTQAYLNCHGQEYLRATCAESYNTEIGVPQYVISAGWIMWYADSYENNPSPIKMTQMGMYGPQGDRHDEERRMKCIKSSRMWDAVRHSHNAYLCPLHADITQQRSGGKLKPYWSYILNGYFRWAKDDEPGDVQANKGRQSLAEGPFASVPDLFMIFCETQMEPIKGLPEPEYTEKYTLGTDMVMQYDGEEGLIEYGGGDPEVIGFNHTVGNKRTAHISFADGHVEQLTLPLVGKGKDATADLANLRDLTAWLCGGASITFDGGFYRLETGEEYKR